MRESVGGLVGSGEKQGIDAAGGSSGENVGLIEIVLVGTGSLQALQQEGGVNTVTAIHGQNLDWSSHDLFAYLSALIFRGCGLSRNARGFMVRSLPGRVRGSHFSPFIDLRWFLKRD
jgi:hypothetical protein